MGRQKARVPVTPQLRRYFQAIGREGGKVGGRKTALKMTAEERQARARKAAAARWGKRRKG